MMLAEQHEIIKYIPQREPMVMISGLLEADDVHAVTEFSISSNNIFTEQGSFAEPGLIENIAQTAAAHVGYQCQLKNIAVPVGYIAAIRNLKIEKLPRVGDCIKTTIKVVNHVMDVTLAQGTVELNGELCCSCEMRIFVKNQ